MFRVDVTDDAKTWASNAQRFITENEAANYARDLAARWTALRAARVVPDSTPEHEAVNKDDAHIVVRYM